jgi:hypothetical protein
MLALMLASALAGEELLVGWAAADITPDRPVALAGQFQTRVSKSVHDPLTATVLALETRGAAAEQAIMISCDLVSIVPEIEEPLRRRVREQLPDFDGGKLFLNATHTHTGPVLKDGQYLIPPEVMTPSEYRVFLVDRLTAAVTQAWRNRKPGGVSWALGQAVVGHNRRAVYEDGTARMYGKTDRVDFRRLEGYEDHGLELLFLWDTRNNLTGVVINIACPSQVVEGESYISADFWHEVRQQIKQRHPGSPYVYAMTGAVGDQSPHLLFRRKAEERLRTRLGLSETEELAQRIANAVDYVLPAARKDIQLVVPFVHKVENVRLPVRKITAAEAERVKQEYERFLKMPATERSRFVQMNRSKEVIRRYERQDKEPYYEMKMHAIRLGDIAIATNPFELFLDYGIQIKARSRAEQTFVAQLSGAGTYLPTAKAVAGGHYSAEAADNRVGPEGGQILVERTLEAINSMWPDAAKSSSR